MSHAQVIKPATGQKLVVHAEGAGRSTVIEIKVKVDNLIGLHAQLLAYHLFEHAPTLQLVGHNAHDGQHILLLAELHTVIHLTVEVNGQIADLQQRTLDMQQSGDRMQRIFAPQNHSAGQTQRAVKPRAHYRTAIDLGIQLGDTTLTGHLRIGLDAEGGRITMGTYHAETCLAKRFTSQAEGIERRVVLGHEELVASLHFAQRA